MDHSIEISESYCPTTSQHRLHRLAQHPDLRVRGAVAQHPGASELTLWLLSRDKDQTTRHMVAINLAAPTAVLQRLARDLDWRIRSRVAQHPYSPPEVVERLSNDPNHWVRRTVIDRERLVALRLNESPLQGLVNEIEDDRIAGTYIGTTVEGDSP